MLSQMSKNCLELKTTKCLCYCEVVKLYLISFVKSDINIVIQSILFFLLTDEKS